MALLPFALDPIVVNPHHHFGLAVNPSDLWTTPPYDNLRMASNPGYLRPWARQALVNNSDGAETKSHVGKNGFQVCLDVQHFKPNEITVKTVDDSIVVEAKHDERTDDHGHISRHFTRRYDLPKGFNAHDVHSAISSDGILTIKAPPATSAIDGNVRHVQIQQVGPAHLHIAKEKSAENDAKK